jgi:EAL domain-containing protein (putative c-di-GMP-specific phosphodiesterase class I)
MAMEKDAGDAKIVRSTIDLAHNLGLTVVAEGVETWQQAHCLLDLGCDIAQGYAIARPMPADEFLAWANQFKMPDLSEFKHERSI